MAGKGKEAKETFSGNDIVTFLSALVVARAALSSLLPIFDCDETYNYWEPTHYFLYGSGLQTWEYSPSYALRGWFYIFLHGIVGWPFVVMGLDKHFVFQIIKAVLAFASCLADALLVSAVSDSFGRDVAKYTAAFLLLSPGTTIAGCSFLPSSFSLQCLTVAFSLQMWFAPGAFHHLVGAIFFVGLAGIVGWPFVGLCVVPMALNILKVYGVVIPLLAAALVLALLSLVVYSFDSMYYGTPVFSTWELVKYNVLGCYPRSLIPDVRSVSPAGLLEVLGCVRDTTGARGSHLFGEEPWYFFFLNLFLNFNVAFLLALASPVLVVLFHVQRMKVLLHLAPLYIWFTFWLFIPHKEERFMQPIYSILCVAGGVCLVLVAKMTPWRVLQRGVRWGTVLVFALLAVSRTTAMCKYYSGPMEIMDVFVTQLPQMEKHIGSGISKYNPSSEVVLCLGREWYRFPSSFFVPADVNGKPVRIQFIRSDFEGLLPKPFGAMGSRSVPPGMNDLNQMDPNQFGDVGRCTYLLSSEFKSDVSKREYNPKHWVKMVKRPFLDAKSSTTAARAFYLPEALHPIARSLVDYRVEYGEMLLLRRIHSS